MYNNTHNISSDGIFLLLVCQNKVDIAVITDASTSVTARNYMKVKAFVVKLTEAFDVGKNRSHFAMIHYSWGAHLDFSFADRQFWDATNLKDKIMGSRYIYGTYKSIRKMFEA